MNIAARIAGWWPLRRTARATSVFADSTMARAAWDRSRRAAMRYGMWGALLGTLIGVVAFAPAAWLASAVASSTDQRVLLADARGSIWAGSAAVVLTGGPGSRDAVALPGRLDWTLGIKGLALELRASQACCLNGTVSMLARPGIGRLSLTLPPMPDGIGQWPAGWLAGLGTPWNTLQLGGSLRIATSGATIEVVQGRWRLDGQASIELSGISSRITTLDTLGSYRIDITGNAAGGDTATLQLSTLDGALQLSGNGQWAGPKLRFRGEATAAEGSEPALNNLLNIIGRRQGTRSIISIG
jgi:general secretion pathway protein N